MTDTTMNTAAAAVPSRPCGLSAEASALWAKYPPRRVARSWPATRQSRARVVARMLAPPFVADTSQDRCNRKLALLKVLDWLELHPGATWQERWNATGVGVDGRLDWRIKLIDDLKAVGNLGPRGERVTRILGLGLAQPGQYVVVVAGSPPNAPGSTNTLRVHQLGSLTHLSGAG